MQDARQLTAELESIFPDCRPTSLLSSDALARTLGVAKVFVKAEYERPLGNFKVLGGAIAALRALRRHGHPQRGSHEASNVCNGSHGSRDANGTIGLLCASDGNHGLAVAYAAQKVGVPATVYLPNSVPAWRAERVLALGGRVHRVDGTYDAAVLLAEAEAAAGQGLLVADTSDDRDDPVVADVMQGYSLLALEACDQLDAMAQATPTHVFMQAGVGGLAAAVASVMHARADRPAHFVVVEPATAACVAAALRIGEPVTIAGELQTSAAMLSCGRACASALDVLMRVDAQSVLVTDEELRIAASMLSAIAGLPITASGAAGLAGALQWASTPAHRDRAGLNASSTVFLVASERSCEP
jgi:diaminopropionate ammonia-lyase